MGLPFYRGSDACGLVFDLSNKASFDKVENWREQFIENCAPKDTDSFPFVLIGNKSDLAEPKVE
jgi:Ras-related protein Rab-7A